MCKFFNKSIKTTFFIGCVLASLLVFMCGCIAQSPLVNSSSNNPIQAKDSSPVVWGPSNLIIDNYSLAASMPVEGSKVMTYISVGSKFSKEWASSLAKNLGMSGIIRETEDAFYADDNDTKQFLFIIQKKSSMITFSGPNKGSGTELSETQVISAVNTFMQKNNLLHSGNVTPRVVNNPIKIYSLSDKRVSERQRYTVIYTQMIDGLPVFGSQFHAEVDPEGNIISLLRTWREYSPYKEVSLRSPEDAFGEFRSRRLQSTKRVAEKVNVTQVSLGYYIQQLSGTTEYLKPVYIFQGYIKHGNTTEDFEPVYVNATQWMN